MNLDNLYYIHRYILPVAFDLLPRQMATQEAHAMLLAIGLQESRFEYRVQIEGPAHGYWQFEKAGGVRGVMTQGAMHLMPVLHTLNYKASEASLYGALVDNDVLAAVFARLLLWSVPGTLPTINQPEIAWKQYIAGWRPGKPHHDTWAGFFAQAWQLTLEEV